MSKKVRGKALILLMVSVLTMMCLNVYGDTTKVTYQDGYLMFGTWNGNGNATVTVVFKVTDSMGPGGVGKETIYEIKVKIIDPESNYWRDDDESASRKKVRFITKKYYDKNKDLDYRDMSSEAIEASSDNGGLNVMSKWYQNADYKALLTGTFEKETGTEYKIDSEKAKKLKEKIETDGIGNSKRDNALTDIYNSLK